jgi:hypothetical protein
MSQRFVLVLLVLALVASAGTVPKLTVYQVKLVKPAVVSGVVLRPGDYKLLVRDTTATLSPSNGGAAVETPVKLETAASKFDSTVITYQSENGKIAISEIDLGGTKTKLLFAQ